MLRVALLLALVYFSSVAAFARSQSGAPAADPFAYDTKQPLDYRDAEIHGV